MRGAIPRHILKAVIEATYYQLWWPAFDRPVYTDRLPVWADGDYIDPDTGVVLPTWTEALDTADTDGRPAHVVRFGDQSDMKGIIAPSEDADRAIRYLTKYLTKAIADPQPNGDQDEGCPDAGWVAHVDRLHAELRWLPCSELCANWLRYGIQPDHAGPGLEPGSCDGPAHDRANLGVGGRRVLVSRKWSGKTLAEHKADRAAVVRETLLTAGVMAPETERMAATVQLPDGSPRFVWTDTKPDPRIYARVILASVLERQRWRNQYEQAKQELGKTLTGAVDNSFRNSDRPP
ncbi:MAG TPA: replication initiator [Microlunatus sp.]|nr:replication initiator [Microlunatus sp.]